MAKTEHRTSHPLEGNYIDSKGELRVLLVKGQLTQSRNPKPFRSRMFEDTTEQSLKDRIKSKELKRYESNKA